MSLVVIEHVDGVGWFDAPLPRRWHRCRPHSSMVRNCTVYERCACGGKRIDGRAWFDRNTRKRAER